MLKRLYVDNVRCLTNFELKPDPVAVLVGPNGTGKSTVFDVLRAVQGFLGTAGAPAHYFFGTGSLTRWDARLTQRVELDVETPGGQPYNYSLEFRHDRERQSVVVHEERLTASERLLYRFAAGEVQLFRDDGSADPQAAFPFDPRRSFLPLLERRQGSTLVDEFKRWVSGIWLFRLRPDLIVPDTKEESDALVSDGSNFVAWYRTLLQESPQITEKVRASLQPVIPGLTGLRLLKIGIDARALVFDCRIGRKDFSLLIQELSEGQRALVVLYTVLHAVAHQARLLVFDEPDNFVAPEEIQPWLSQLRDHVIEAKQATVLVISHHPEVVDYLAADQVLHFSRADSGPSRVRQIDVDREAGLSASEWLKLRAADG